MKSINRTSEEQTSRSGSIPHCLIFQLISRKTYKIPPNTKKYTLYISFIPKKPPFCQEKFFNILEQFRHIFFDKIVQKRLTSLFAGSYGDWAGEKIIGNLRCRDYFSIFSALEIRSEYRARSRISRKARGKRGRNHPESAFAAATRPWFYELTPAKNQSALLSLIR